MGRTVIAEENIDKQIASLYGQDEWYIGLILGQTTSQKDYALHIARTPQEEEGIPSTTKIKPYTSKSCLDGIDDQWVCTHARQILRMLPGGLDIIGIFAFAPPEVMKKAQMKLRQILYAVHKTVCKSDLLSISGTDPHLDRLILQICSVTRKITCKTFDVSDSKSAAKPADWKYQSVIGRWHSLDCSVAVSIAIPVPKPATSHSLERQILNGIKPLCENIQNSLVLINGVLRPTDSPLCLSHANTKKRKGQTADDMTGTTYRVQLFEQTKCLSESQLDEPQTVDCGAKMLLRGSVCSRAFVHGKATCAESIQAVKTDIIRSLVSRCELLCEDLLQAEEEQDRRVLYETPMRVFGPLSESGQVQVCDYMFQDETVEDSADRFKVLMDLPLAPISVDTECEHVPEDADLVKPEHQVRQLSRSHSNSNAHSSFGSRFTFSTTLKIAVSAGVAAVAGAISYMVMEQ